MMFARTARRSPFATSIDISSGACPWTSASSRASHCRATAERATAARRTTLASKTALTTISVLADELLRSRRVVRPVDLRRDRGEPLHDHTRVPTLRFRTQDLDRLRVHGSPVPTRPARERFVDPVRDVPHVQRPHAAMLAICKQSFANRPSVHDPFLRLELQPAFGRA